MADRTLAYLFGPLDACQTRWIFSIRPLGHHDELAQLVQILWHSVSRALRIARPGSDCGCDTPGAFVEEPEFNSCCTSLLPLEPFIMPKYIIVPPTMSNRDDHDFD